MRCSIMTLDMNIPYTFELIAYDSHQTKEALIRFMMECQIATLSTEHGIITKSDVDHMILTYTFQKEKERYGMDDTTH